MSRATIERLTIDDEALWIEDGGRPRGYPIGSSALRQWLDDTRDRLNALAGIPDPVAFVAAAREVVGRIQPVPQQADRYMATKDAIARLEAALGGKA